MGLDLIQSGDSFFTELLAVASDRLTYDLRTYITDAADSDFVRSANLQPLITAVSLAYWKKLRDEGVHFDTVIGHSLGEITALAGAGVLSPYDCVDVAAFRGQVMDECASLCGGGGMAVVLFSDEETVKKSIEMYGLTDSLYIANYNAPNQTVISGTHGALNLFGEKFQEEHRAKIQKIDVAGPWHTPFITLGREKYLEWAAKKEFSSPKIQFIMNGTADVASVDENFLVRTADQLIKPVFWSRSLQKMSELNPQSLVIEVGPGKILSGLIRANRLQKSFVAIESMNSVEALPTVVNVYHEITA